MLANTYSFGDLLIAYRKAKVDVFYESGQAMAQKFAEYEENLEINLYRLLERIDARDWMEDPAVIGSYTFVPKSVENTKSNDLTIFSSSKKSWEEFCNSNNSKPKVNFRVMSSASVEWHIISALWIFKEGHKLDAALDPRTYASRLRRRKPENGNKLGAYHEWALGSFAPYPPQYIAWRNDGLKATRTLLDEGEEVIAFTADLRSFFHSIDPNFLITEEFETAAGLDKGTVNHSLTQDLIKSFSFWSNKAPPGSNGKKTQGLPIGIGASRIIANVILLSFDEMIAKEIAPAYYGRYVDDVILVLRNQWSFKSGDEVWMHLCKSSGGVLKKGTEVKETVYKLHLLYDKGRSNLRFAGGKQKVFFLEGKSGKALIQTIESHIRQNTSEWRLLPEVDERDLETIPDFVAAGQDHSETPDNFRKSDGLSFRRLQLAFHLRDLEAFADDLHPKEWKNERRQFFELVCEHLVALPHFFTYYPYLERVIALGVAANDWRALIRLVKCVVNTFETVEETCNYNANHFRQCKRDLGRKFYIAICKSLQSYDSESDEQSHEVSQLLGLLKERLRVPKQSYNVQDIRVKAHRLFVADLARIPFRRHLLYGETPVSDDRPRGEGILETDQMVDLENTWSDLFPGQQGPIPLALLLPTRPFSPAEISSIAPPFKSPRSLFSGMRKWMQSIRGITFFDDVDQFVEWHPPKAGPDFWVPGAPFKGSLRVALPCLNVSAVSWTAAVSGEPEPDGTRYRRTAKLINDIIQAHERADYVVLPELSLKLRWFWRFANKLAANRISLISGIEYQAAPSGKPNEVINQARVSLVTDGPGYSTFLVYSQNKKRAPKGEQLGLMSIANKKLVPGEHAKKRIIRHGDFQFGILICSEITNLKFRAKFRGRVDALFIPEWNQDVGHFSPIIESSANDVHAFVVQANNRLHGDSRIRAPYKQETWKRNLIRLTGGANDYFAIGKIEFYKLRQFQSNHISPESPFKPVPDGFKIDPSRRELPQGGNLG